MRCSPLLLTLVLVVVVTTEATRDTDRQLFSICSSAEVDNTVSIIDRIQFICQDWCRSRCQSLGSTASCTGTCRFFQTRTWQCGMLTGRGGSTAISGYTDITEQSW